jgi:hypothetical protein
MRREDIFFILFIFFISVVMRVAPHAPNFTPLGALALFGGSYLPRRLALTLPIFILLLTDFLLGFHQSMPYVYGSFALTTIIGIWLRDKKSFGNIFVASVVSSILFFLITNFGFWLSYSLYPKTFSGQVTAYVMALPFFRNTLISTVLFSFVFFGGYTFYLRFVKGGRYADLHTERG